MDDNAAVCDNCGFQFEKDEREMAEEFSSQQVPAIPVFSEAESDGGGKKSGDIFVRIIAVIGAVACFAAFFSGAAYMDAAIAGVQSQSFVSGFFGSSTGSLPAELFAGLRQGMLAMGVGFSAIILILGFKKAK